MKEFLTHLLAAGEALAPHVHQGAPAAIRAAKAILAALEAGKEIGAVGDQEELDATIDKLQDLVSQHAEETAASLRKPQ